MTQEQQAQEQSALPPPPPPPFPSSPAQAQTPPPPPPPPASLPANDESGGASGGAAETGGSVRSLAPGGEELEEGEVAMDNAANENTTQEDRSEQPMEQSQPDRTTNTQQQTGDGAAESSERRENGDASSTALGKRAWGARDQDAYEIINQIGQGTFGQVFKARDKRDNSLVALKRIKMEQEHEGFPITAIREIKILKNLKHPNIVDLREVIVSSRDRPDEGDIYMVFEYVDYDLTGLMDSPGVVLTELHVKTYMYQLLTGAMVMHKNHIIHRDIKGPNLLITRDGCLKIADWGLARAYYTNEVRYTNRVITLWYRPPELLLGTESYGPAVDMWSIGCLFAEMKVRKAILQGRDEMNQLELIYKLCGTPNDERWPAARTLPKWGEMQFAQTYEPTIDQRFADFSGPALDLLKALLEMDPTKRMTAENALSHDYFWTPPMPIREPENLHLLPRFNLEAAHEWATKKQLKEAGQTGRPGRGGDRAPGVGGPGRYGGRGPPPGIRGRGRGPPPRGFRSGGQGRGGGSWGRGSGPFRR